MTLPRIARRRQRHALLPLAVALALAPALAGAQEADAQAPAGDATTLDRIVVTGSSIPRTTTETASPVQVISRQEIDRTGKATIAEYLQTLTADGQGSIPKSFGNGFAGGGAGISLRGLGAGSTLVLLNGRRMAPYGLADDGQKVFTDLSTIPMDAVERIEVLKDGASAIYGSDAIAGVVNIILRRDFTGVVARASYGLSEESDIPQRKGTLTAGWGDLAEDDYNFFFSLDASKTDSILASDRRGRKWIGTGDIRPWGYDVVGSGFLGGFIIGNGTVTSATTPTGAIQDPATGLWSSLPGCAQLSNVNPPDPGGGCLWDVAQYRNLVPDEEYLNFFSRGTFAINDSAELYTEFGWSKKKTRFVNGFSGVAGAWGYPGGPVNANSGPGATVLGPDHPDNPMPGVAVRVRYGAFDVGPRVTTNENEFVRFLAGVTGTAGAWDYDAGYLHSETSLFNERTGYLRYSRVRTVLEDPNSPVGWWRIGDDSGLNTQALYDYISPTIHADASSELDMVDAKASRSLMDLPGGPLGLALGAEYRRQSVELTPQSFTDIGDIIGLGFSAYSGTQKVAAAYAELLAPVTSTLELNAALRVDSYEGGETSTTPKLGVKWTPADWIALRGTYAEGFRAPNPAESGDGGLAAFSTAADPVRCPNGVPVPGGNATNADCAAPIAIITTPNPDLKPETSKSYTVGLVLEPTASTSLTLDAYEIKRKDEIAPESTALAIAAGRVVRNDNDLPGIPNSGTLLAVNTAYVNAAETVVRGWDLDIRQRFELGAFGKLLLDLQWTRINSLSKTDGGTTFEYAGTHGNCDVTNCIGTPKDRANFGATWDVGAFSLSSVVNWRTSMENVPFRGEACANNLADGSPAPSKCSIDSFYSVDLTGRWRPTASWELFATVANVTDKIAPLDPLTYGSINYNPMDVSGAIGRYYTVGAKYTFE